MEEPGKTPLTTLHVQNSSQAERVRTTGQSDSPIACFPEDGNLSPYPDITADHPARPTLFSVCPVLHTGMFHQACNEFSGVPSRTLALKKQSCINVHCCHSLKLEGPCRSQHSELLFHCTAGLSLTPSLSPVPRHSRGSINE